MSDPGTAPGSTLVEELEQAAPFVEAAARRCHAAGDRSMGLEMDAFAGRLRERAALVRELSPGRLHETMQNAPHDADPYRMARAALGALTGPIAAPRETM